MSEIFPGGESHPLPKWGTRSLSLPQHPGNISRPDSSDSSKPKQEPSLGDAIRVGMENWDQIQVSCPLGQLDTATSTSWCHQRLQLPPGAPQTSGVLSLLLQQGLNFPALSPQLWLCRRSCHAPVAAWPQEGSFQKQQSKAQLWAQLWARL